MQPYSTITVFLAASLYFTPLFASYALAVQDETTQEAGESSLTDPDIELALDELRAGNTTKGLSLLQSLGEAGNALAFYHLGETARLGIGRDASPAIAMMFFRLAAQMDHEIAAMKLANMLYFREGALEGETTEAVTLWKKYALMDNREAQFVLGIIYWDGDLTGQPDPVRGYGLVWRAAEAGYDPAVQAELSMRAQLPGVARDAGEDYGRHLEERGIEDDPLKLELLVEGYVPPVDTAASPPDPPENWKEVWRLEVGFALKREDAETLLADIKRKQAAHVVDLASAIVPAPGREGSFRLLFGPMGGLNDAVKRCVQLKRGGYDCFAKAPGQ